MNPFFLSAFSKIPRFVSRLLYAVFLKQPMTKDLVCGYLNQADAVPNATHGLRHLSGYHYARYGSEKNRVRWPMYAKRILWQSHQADAFKSLTGNPLLDTMRTFRNFLPETEPDQPLLSIDGMLWEKGGGANESIELTVIVHVRCHRC